MEKYHANCIHKKNEMVILISDKTEFKIKHVTSDKDIYNYKRVNSSEDKTTININIITTKPHIS